MSKLDIKDIKKRHIREMEINEQLDEEERKRRRRQGEDDAGGGITYGTLAASTFGIFAIIAGVIIYNQLPYTHSAKIIEYSRNDIIQGAMTATMKPENKQEYLAENGIDFSRILTPAQSETLAGTKNVARACLKGKPDLVVAPGDTKALGGFNTSTKFMICALRTNPERLCASEERARLAEQLTEYRNVKQNIAAIVHARAAFKDSYEADPKARVIKKQYKKYLELTANEKGTTESELQSIVNGIDQRILKELNLLVQKGYLSTKDFGFMGMYIPEEYASALIHEGPTQRSCG